MSSEELKFGLRIIVTLKDSCSAVDLATEIMLKCLGLSGCVTKYKGETTGEYALRVADTCQDSREVYIMVQQITGAGSLSEADQRLLASRPNAKGAEELEEEEPAEEVKKPEIDTSEAGLTEILTEDGLVNERIEQELQKGAQERKCELRELRRLLKTGLIVQDGLEDMGMVCDPATGKLLALEFLRVDDDKTIWIAPGDDFDMVFDRLHRMPTDVEIAKVKEEAESLGCKYGGWQMEGGHCVTDTTKTQSTFIVVPGRPVIDALRECWDRYDVTLAETKPVTEH